MVYFNLRTTKHKDQGFIVRNQKYKEQASKWECISTLAVIPLGKVPSLLLVLFFLVKISTFK